jgi:hypothetical protein
MSMSLVEELNSLPRAEAVTWFLHAWHATPEPPQVPGTPQIPALLVRLLALCRTYPTICSQQNRLIEPVEVDDGLLCFYVENQNVYRWAYRPGEDDPIVVGRYLNEAAWVAEQERLSGFLLQVCLYEAIMSAPYSASASGLTPEALAHVLESGRLRPVLSPWRWPEEPTVFQASDGAVAVTSQRRRANGTLSCNVMVGAPHAEPLAYLPDIIRQDDDRWEHAELAGFQW